MEFLEDIKNGFSRKRLWTRLAVLELKSRYQGAFLGVFWIVLTLMLKVGMLSIIYSMVFDKDIKEQVIFLTLGVLTWNFISAVIINSATIFIKAGNFLQQMKLPHSIFVLQNVFKESVILLLYQFVAIPVVLIINGVDFISWIWLWSLLGYVLIVINSFFVSMWLGWLSVRFRDVQPFLGSAIMILFLITPVLWPPPEKFADSLYFILNPFFHLLETVRAPILSGEVPYNSYIVAVGLLLVNILVCFVFYRRVKDRLVLWL